jgi:hypothetical protein
MAILLDTSTGTRHVLKPYHVFGRSSRHADCVLPTPDVSLIHAFARWDAHRWTLVDESRNGSFVNGERLAKDSPTTLHVGDGISFGTPDMPPWKVVDLSAPADLLLPLSLGLSTIVLASFQNLPDDAEPLACIYRSPSGQWVEETKDGVTLLNHGDTVYIGGHAWRLACAEDRLNTLVPSSLITCMTFRTSRDEEHVSLSLTRGRATLDLGELAYHYLLLLLARQRLADIAHKVEPSSQGWIEFESLVKMLDMDKAHLHIHIFRLRKQFEAVVAQGLLQQDFIERRRGGAAACAWATWPSTSGKARSPKAPGALRRHRASPLDGR